MHFRLVPTSVTLDDLERLERLKRHSYRNKQNFRSPPETRSSATAEKQRVSCPHGGGSSPVHSPFPLRASGYTYAYGRIRNPQQTYVKRTVRKAHFKLNRAFKVIQGYPYLCRQEPRAVYCRNVQLMPPLFLKLTKIWQQKVRNTANSSISTTPLKFEDVPARNAFEYLQTIYIARN